MYSKFNKKESYVVHISFYAARGWNRQVIPDRVNQWSTTWVIFLWCPIIVPLVCAFFPYLRMITLKPVPLCSSRSHKSWMHKYNNYDKATYIVSSNLCLFICSQVQVFPWNSYPQRHISAIRSSPSNSSPCLCVDFSNNISIP